jgi:hypothetical protein
VFVGAGDVADCTLSGAELTARLLDRTPGTVFMLGDGAYGDGKLEEYLNCYEPTWGRHLGRTRPVPGNHDYSPASLRGFFTYFAGQIGEGGRSYYEFRLGAWRVYALDSNIDAGQGSAQYQWLANALPLESGGCTLAYWHHPLVSSSKGGDNHQMLPLWRLLVERGADVVLNGHAHAYERFAPMGSSLSFDPAGIRQFTVGTGGARLYPFESVAPLGEARISAWGVLKLVLSNGGYSWQFMPAAAGSPSDSGQAACH